MARGGVDPRDRTRSCPRAGCIAAAQQPAASTGRRSLDRPETLFAFMIRRATLRQSCECTRLFLLICGRVAADHAAAAEQPALLELIARLRPLDLPARPVYTIAVRPTAVDG